MIGSPLPNPLPNPTYRGEIDPQARFEETDIRTEQDFLRLCREFDPCLERRFDRALGYLPTRFSTATGWAYRHSTLSPAEWCQAALGFVKEFRKDHWLGEGAMRKFVAERFPYALLDEGDANEIMGSIIASGEFSPDAPSYRRSLAFSPAFGYRLPMDATAGKYLITIYDDMTVSISRKEGHRAVWVGDGVWDEAAQTVVDCAADISSTDWELIDEAVDLVLAG